MPLSQDDIIKYKSLYLETAKNYIENMQLNISYLLKAEQVQSAIKQVHIDAHSLKSQSQIMGYLSLAKISELIEFIFNKAENENKEISHNDLIKIQSDITRLMDSLNQIKDSGTEIDLTDRVEALEKIKG